MSIFQDTLAKTEENHRREIADLKKVFQTELALLKQQLLQFQAQPQTVHKPTSSVTVEAKLDIIMQHLQLTVPIPEEQSPSPPCKRRDNSTTPPTIKTNQLISSQTEDQLYPETSHAQQRN